MQLNENTMAVLKNFATIQDNIVMNEGTVVKTIAEAKNVMAVANLDQSFDKTVGVHDQRVCMLLNVSYHISILP